MSSAMDLSPLEEQKRGSHRKRGSRPASASGARIDLLHDKAAACLEGIKSLGFYLDRTRKALVKFRFNWKTFAFDASQSPRPSAKSSSAMRCSRWSLAAS